MSPQAIDRLDSNAVVQVVDTMLAGERKKTSKTVEQCNQSATDKRSSEADAAFELMETIVRTGRVE